MDQHSDPNHIDPERVRHALFLAFFGALRRFAPKLDFDTIDRELKGALSEMRAPAEVTWENASPMTAFASKRVSHVGRVVRIVGRIVEMGDPQVATLRDEEGHVDRHDATCIAIMDVSGDTIWSLDILGDALITRLGRHRSLGSTVEFLGVIVSLPTKLNAKRPDAILGEQRADFLLHVLDVRLARSAFDLLAATADERSSATAELAKVEASQQSLLVYLRDRIIDALGIQGLDKFPLLRELIEFTVLQAVAIGRVGNAPGNLHLLLVGPPGRGKKLVGLAAKALNPVCSEVSAAKTSSAGLVGASSKANGRWVSVPGLLPKASGGVTLVQDAHEWNTATLGKFSAVLQEVMEDGVVRDAVAGGVTRDAQTGLLIDMNRGAQARTGATRQEAALLRLRPALSRFDTVIEIPVDNEAAWDVAGQLFTGVARAADDGWMRRTRLLIAAIRDRYPDVDLTPIVPLMRQAHRVIGDRLMKLEPDAGDWAARLSVSFMRFATASARANARTTATEEDALCAAAYVRRKVDFITKSRVRMSDCPSEDEWLDQYVGREVTVSDVTAAYNEKTGKRTNHKTFLRHIQARPNRPIMKGVYFLVPPAGPDSGSDDRTIGHAPDASETDDSDAADEPVDASVDPQASPAASEGRDEAPCARPEGPGHSTGPIIGDESLRDGPDCDEATEGEGESERADDAATTLRRAGTSAAAASTEAEPEPSNAAPLGEGSAALWVQLAAPDLKAALQLLSAVKPRVVTHTGFAGYLVRVENGGCSIRSTSATMDVEVRLLTTDAVGEGAFVLPTASVDAVLAATSPITVGPVEHDDGKWSVVCRGADGADTTISTVNAELFSRGPLPMPTEWRDVPAGVLREALKLAKPFVAQARDCHVEDKNKAVVVFDDSDPAWVKGDGYLFASDSVRCLYFRCELLKGLRFAASIQDVPAIAKFLGCDGGEPLRLGTVDNWFVLADGGGHVMCWQRPEKVHSKFTYYSLKADRYVLTIPTKDFIAAVKSALASLPKGKTTATLTYDAADSALTIGTPFGTYTSASMPVETDRAAGTWTWRVSADSLLSLVVHARAETLQLRVAFVVHEGKEFGLIRTIESFRLSEAGKVVSGVDGHECVVTRFMPTRD